MNTRALCIAPLALALSLLSGTAQAALQGRDLNGSAASFEAYYDTELNVTWLADANSARTSGYDADGKMTWAAANTWAANLSFIDAVNNITYDNWRLPTVNPINGSSFNDSNSYNGSTDLGYNISEQGTVYAGSTANEMAHLFYNTLDNKGYCPVSTNCSTAQVGWGLSTGPLTNLQASYYWSGLEYAPRTNSALLFNFGLGYQAPEVKSSGFYALAVSPGDIAAVPEADTWAMLLAGLGLVGGAGLRRRR